MTPDQQFRPVTARRALATVASLCLLGGLQAGCSTAPPLPPPPVQTTTPPASWLDAVVPDGQAQVFLGQSYQLVLARTAGAVTLTVRPLNLAAPRLTLRADPPGDPPLRSQPIWGDLTYVPLFGRPYRIVTRYPRLGGADARGRAEIIDYGITEYYIPTLPPDRPHLAPYHADIVPFTSPLHLLLAALGPVPDGRTRIRALHKTGTDYWATIDADADRRELRFPYALMWSDWTQQNLDSQCVFRVRCMSEWPAATIELENLGRLGDVDGHYDRTEPVADRPHQ